MSTNNWLYLSLSDLNLTKRASGIRKSRLLFLGLFILAIISITTTMIFTITDIDFMKSNSPDEKEHELVISNQQNQHHDKRIIIFPNNFELSDNKLSEYYINNLEEALDPQDLIFKNKFLYKLPKDLSFTKQEIDLFSSGSDSSTEDQCPSLLNKINVEASPAYNKNVDLKKILTKFMNENSLYYQELEPFFPDLKQQLKDDIIDKHWYQLIGSSVYLKQYGVHLMISRIIYSVKDQGTPQFSLTYLQVFDRNWNELENVELIVPNEDGKTFKPILYPQFAQMPVYHNSKQIAHRFYGVEDPRIQLITNPQGIEEPIIIYNSHHRKILKTEFDNDNEGTIKFNSYRSIFIGWIWKTQTGKSNLEELPIKDQKISQLEYIKVRELLRPNNKRKGTEKNWALFLNNAERIEYGFDKYLHFVYQFKNIKILKCPLYFDDNDTENNANDEACIWEYEADDYMGSGLLHGGSELINVNQVLQEYKYPELESLLDKFPPGRELWVGFARAVLRNCGCGSHMYRPNLVVLMKDQDKYKFAYISSFMQVGIEILPWFDYDNKGLCEGKNLIIPNGVSSWTIEKDDETGELNDYMAFTISRRDATVDVVYMKGLLNALLIDDPNPKLLNHEQQGFVTNTHVDCALKSSDKFCKTYGKLIEEEEKELKTKQDDKDKEKDKEKEKE